MTQANFKEGEVLYHASHGPCRITEIVKQKGLKERRVFYALVPQQEKVTKTRFLVPVDRVDISGFHQAVTHRQQKEILNYLKTYDGEKSVLGAQKCKEIRNLVEQNTPWSLARALLMLCRDPDADGTKGKKDLLVRAGQGLAQKMEASHGVSRRKAVLWIGSSLRTKKINPWADQILRDLR